MTPMLYASAHWLTLDPLANKYYGISPYAFCANTHINFVDPDGNSWGKAFKVVKKIYKTVKAGVSGGKKQKEESHIVVKVRLESGIEKNHAEELKSLNQLDPTKHIRP